MLTTYFRALTKLVSNCLSELPGKANMDAFIEANRLDASSKFTYFLPSVCTICGKRPASHSSAFELMYGTNLCVTDFHEKN